MASSFVLPTNSGVVFHTKKLEEPGGSQNCDDENLGNGPSNCDFSCSEILAAVFKVSQHLMKAHNVAISVSCTLCEKSFGANKEVEEHSQLHNSMTHEVVPKKATGGRIKLGSWTEGNYEKCISVEELGNERVTGTEATDVHGNLGLTTRVENLSDFDSGKLRNQHGNETTSIVDEVQQGDLDNWDDDIAVSPFIPELDPLDISILASEFIKTESVGSTCESYSLHQKRPSLNLQEEFHNCAKIPDAKSEDCQKRIFSDLCDAPDIAANKKSEGTTLTKTRKQTPVENNFPGPCNECGLTFGSAELLQVHSSYHTLKVNGNFQCLICSKYLRTLQEYQTHLGINCGGHSKNKNIKMPSVCYTGQPSVDDTHEEGVSVNETRENLIFIEEIPQELVTTSALGRNYMRTRSQTYKKSEKIHRCDDCGRVYANKEEFDEHLQKPYHKIPHVCDECGQKFVETQDYESHMKVKHDLPPYKCKHCQRILKTYISHRRHIQTFHKTEAKVLKCTKCPKTFNSKIQYDSHLKYHIKKGTYTCDTCGKHIASPRLMRIHLMEHSGKEQVTCEYCNHPFLRQKSLNQHLKYNCKKKDKNDPTDKVSCNICGKQMYPMHLKNHLLRHDKGFHGVHRCPRCSEVFMQESTRNRHLQYRHPNYAGHICKQCWKAFPSRELLEEHTTDPTETNNFICDVCGKCLATLCSFKNHMSRHDTEVFMCHECGNLYKTSSDLRKHAEIHARSDAYSCKFCDFKAKMIPLVSDHVKRVHFRHGPFDENDKHNQEKKYFCDICGEGFVREESVYQHRIYHDEANKNVKCKYSDCKETFFTIHERFYHIRRTHEKFKCEFCGMEFLYSHSLKNHRRYRHTKETPYKCTYCDRSFKVKAELTHHTVTHTGDYKFSCEICGRKCVTKVRLRNHLLVHEGYPCRKCGFKCGSMKARASHKCGDAGEEQASEKPKRRRIRSNLNLKPDAYSCKFCDFKASISSLISFHIRRVHFRHGSFSENDKQTQGKNYFCDACGEGFVLEDSLHQHQIYHDVANKIVKCTFTDCEETFFTTYERFHHLINTHQPFQCEICGKNFAYERTLAHHKRTTHTEKDPYKCSHCDKSYKSMAGLNRHNVTHTGDYKFSCDICGKKFLTSNTLDQHSLSHEGFPCGKCSFKCGSRRDRAKHKCEADNQGRTSERSFGNHTSHSALQFDPGSYLCKFCDYKAKDSSTISRHYRLFHYRDGPFNENDQQNREKKYFCDVCGDGFVREVSLQQHQIHHDEANKIVKCKYSECNQTFFTVYGRYHHVRSTHEQFKCEFCGREFAQKNTLLIHRRYRHTKEAPFKCTYCDKSYTIKFDLTHHIATHTGDYKFICDVCGKKFITDGKLRRPTMLFLVKITRD